METTINTDRDAIYCTKRRFVYEYFSAMPANRRAIRRVQRDSSRVGGFIGGTRKIRADNNDDNKLHETR